MKRTLLGLLLLALAPGAGAAQAPLPDVLDRLADLWSRAEVAAIAEMVAADGVDVEIEGQSMGALTGRKMVAALRRMFEDRETVGVRSSMSARVVGTDDRAFGELVWDARPPGGTVPERSMVFLALVREADEWRLSQIRILPSK